MEYKRFEEWYRPASLQEHAGSVNPSNLTIEGVINLVTAFLFETLSVNPEGSKVQQIKTQAQEAIADLFLVENPNFEQRNFKYAVEVLVDIWATSQIFGEVLLRAGKHTNMLDIDEVIVWDVGSGVGILTLAVILGIGRKKVQAYLIDHSRKNFETGERLISKAINDVDIGVNGVYADVSGYPKFHEKMSIPDLFSLGSRMQDPNIIIAEIIDTVMPPIQIEGDKVLIDGKSLDETQIYEKELIKDPYPYFLDSFYKRKAEIAKDGSVLVWPFPGESLIYNSELPAYQRWGIRAGFASQEGLFLPLPLVGARFWGFQHFLNDPRFLSLRWVDRNIKRKVMSDKNDTKCCLLADCGEINIGEINIKDGKRFGRRIIKNYLRRLVSQVGIYC